MEKLYKRNKDFRDYVDKYCLKHRLIPEVAIKHKLVSEYGEMCREREEIENDGDNM